jgi:hypothetical protein
MPDLVSENEARGSNRLAPHGTIAAVRRHHRHHEKLCDPCAAVSKVDRAKRYREDHERGQEPVEVAKRTAKARAYRLLAERHLMEWTLLLSDTIADELERKGLAG